MTFDKAIELVKSNDYKNETIGEYCLAKDKYNKLYLAIIKKETDKFNFESNCTIKQEKTQTSTMERCLFQFEIKDEIEDYNLDVN